MPATNRSIPPEGWIIRIRHIWHGSSARPIEMAAAKSMLEYVDETHGPLPQAVSDENTTNLPIIHVREDIYAGIII
jgi:hypothetical protein